MSPSADVARSQIEKAAKALLQFEKEQNPLFEDNDVGVYLGATLRKVEKILMMPKPKLFSLPHPVILKSAKVCLFIKDADDRPSKLCQANLKLHLDKVISHSKLHRKYSQYENLRQLVSRFELFVVDERILRATYKILGKTFRRKALKPVPIQVEGKSSREIEEEIQRIRKSAIFVAPSGSALSIKIGRSDFTADQIADNTKEAIKVMESKFVQWPNIASLHLKTTKSPACMIYYGLPPKGGDDKAKTLTTSKPNMKRKAGDKNAPTNNKASKPNKTNTNADNTKSDGDTKTSTKKPRRQRSRRPERAPADHPDTPAQSGEQEAEESEAKEDTRASKRQKPNQKQAEAPAGEAQSPASEDKPAPKDTPKTKATPKAKDTPKTQDTPTTPAHSTPKTKNAAKAKTPQAKETPAPAQAEDAPKTPKGKGAAKTPKSKDTPKADDAATTEDAPKRTSTRKRSAPEDR